MIARFTLWVAIACMAVTAEAANIAIQTDEEKWVISDRLINMHLRYDNAYDSMYADGSKAAWAAGNRIFSARYPGGGPTSRYHWEAPSGYINKDSWDPAWNGVPNNSSKWMSLDEYLTFCHQGNLTPMVGINHESGVFFDRLEDSIREASNCVQHVVDAGFPGAVYYIGNEDVWEIGGPDDAARVDVEIAKAMKAVDPDISIYWNNNNADPQIVGDYLDIAGEWIDGIETHSKWPYGGADFSPGVYDMTNWLGDWPLREYKKGEGRIHREYAQELREAATRAGYPNLLIANNEYGWGKSPGWSGFNNRYQYSMVMADFLQEMFIGNYDSAAFWDNSRVNSALISEQSLFDYYNGNRLNPVHMSWEMLGQAQGATMLGFSSDSTMAYGFAAKDQTQIHLYLINKSTSAEPVSISLAGIVTVDDGMGPAGVSMVDTADHWGTNQVLTVSGSAGSYSATLPGSSYSHIIFPRAATGDTVAPAAPQGGFVSVSTDSATLHWDASTEGDFLEYRLYRSTRAGRDYRPVAMNLTTNSYTDNELVDGQTYYYVLEAVDTNDNVSARSAEIVCSRGSYSPVFVADFQESLVEDSTSTSNFDAGTWIGAWSSLPSTNLHVRRDAVDSNLLGQIVSQAALFDQGTGGFAAEANLVAPVGLDGTLVSFDTALRAWGGSGKDITIAGMDALGNVSFELVISASGDAGLSKRLGYMHSGSTVTMIPQGADNEINWLGDDYNPETMRNVRLKLSDTGYRVDFHYGTWISDELPYNGSAANVAKIVISGGNATAFWVDNLRIQELIPPNNNQPPYLFSDPVLIAQATENVPFSGDIAGLAGDPEGDSLSFLISSGPAWLDVSTNGVLYGTPSSADLGWNSFAVMVRDGNGGSDTAALNIQVLTTSGSAILAAWETGTAGAPTIQDASVDAGLVLTGNSIAASGQVGSTDGSYGTLAGASDTPYNNSFELATAPADAGEVFHLIFAITNAGAEALLLDSIHFDAYRTWNGAPKNWSLTYAGGDPALTNGLVLGADMLVNQTNSLVTGIGADYEDIDIYLTSNMVLAVGEHAVFDLAVSGQTGVTSTYIDNLALFGRWNPVAPPTPYDTWATTWFSESELADTNISGAAAIPIGDGLPNLIKYALNLDPWAYGGVEAGWADAAHWVVGFDRNTNAVDVDLYLETVSNLVGGTWMPVAYSLKGTSVSAVNGATVLQDAPGQTNGVQVAVPLGTNAFFRFRVEQE